MATRSRKKPLHPWLTTKSDGMDIRFIQVGNSLLLSPQFKELSVGARSLYCCAAMESGGKKGFTFPAATMEKYGFPIQSGRRYIKELMKNGFIKCTYCGQSQMNPNEYEFIFDWKRSKAAPLFSFNSTEATAGPMSNDTAPLCDSTEPEK